MTQHIHNMFGSPTTTPDTREGKNVGRSVTRCSSPAALINARLTAFSFEVTLMQYTCRGGGGGGGCMSFHTGLRSFDGPNQTVYLYSELVEGRTFLRVLTGDRERYVYGRCAMHAWCLRKIALLAALFAPTQLEPAYIRRTARFCLIAHTRV